MSYGCTLQLTNFAILRNGTLFSSCEWFFKLDTDAFVNHRHVARHLNAITNIDGNEGGRGSHYVGAFSNYGPTGVQFASGGSGYALSRGLVQRLRLTECWAGVLERKSGPAIAAFEDVTMGHCINSLPHIRHHWKAFLYSYNDTVIPGQAQSAIRPVQLTSQEKALRMHTETVGTQLAVSWPPDWR